GAWWSSAAEGARRGFEGDEGDAGGAGLVEHLHDVAVAGGVVAGDEDLGRGRTEAVRGETRGDGGEGNEFAVPVGLIVFGDLDGDLVFVGEGGGLRAGLREIHGHGLDAGEREGKE